MGPQPRDDQQPKKWTGTQRCIWIVDIGLCSSRRIEWLFKPYNPAAQIISTRRYLNIGLAIFICPHSKCHLPRLG